MHITQDWHVSFSATKIEQNIAKNSLKCPASAPYVVFRVQLKFLYLKWN